MRIVWFQIGKALAWAFFVLSGACIASVALAAAFPERPINIIVPFAAGGGTDVTARLFGRGIEKHLAGARVVITPRPGATGEIGAIAAAESKPDGYTLVILVTPNVLSVPIERQSRYTLDSFDLIANLVDDPGTISVRSDSPIRNVAELIAASKTMPGGIAVGTSGIGSTGHIAMLLMQKQYGFNFRNIPFSGHSAARTAMLSRDIPASFANLGETIGYAKGQPWRTLGQMSPQRSDLAPTLLTFAEQGYPIEGGSLRGLAAPKGLPSDVLETLVSTIDKVMADPEFIANAKAIDHPLRYIKRDEYARVLREMDARLREIWKSTPWN